MFSPLDAQTPISGTISGIMEMAEQSIRDLGGSVDPALCSGITIDSVVDLVKSGADILAGGTQNPNLVCDYVSVGLGFTTVRANLGAVLPPAPPKIDPCL